MNRYTVQGTPGKPFFIEGLKGRPVYAVGEEGDNIIAFTTARALVPMFGRGVSWIAEMVPALIEAHKADHATRPADSVPAVLLVEQGSLVGIAIADEKIIFSIPRVSYHEGLYEFETVAP